MVEKTNWFTGLGVVFLVIGFYASARLLVNMTLIDPYPLYGVIPDTSNTGIYLQTEADCQAMKPYMDQSMTPEAQIQQNETDKANCYRTVAQERGKARDADINAAALFTALGLGMLLLRKFLPRIF